MSLQTPLGCWILSSGGLTIFSHATEQGKVDEQLFGGVLSAILSFAHSLGHDIHKIDFGKSTLVTFEIVSIRIILLLRNPLTEEEISLYHDHFLALEKKHPSSFKVNLFYKQEDSPLIHEVLRLFNLTEDIHQLTNSIELRTILSDYKEHNLKKKDAAKKMVELSKGLDVDEEGVKDLYQKLDYLVKNIGFDEQEQKLFSELMAEYQTGLLKAHKNLKTSLFR